MVEIVDIQLLLSISGYCFAIANLLIGAYNVRDLNKMKGDLVFVKAHRLFGLTETTVFYAVAFLCIAALSQLAQTEPDAIFADPTVAAHTWIGGFIGTLLFTPKPLIGFFKKNTIYKYGQFIGPIGFIGWSLAHWTALIDYNFYVRPSSDLLGLFVSALIPFLVGPLLFLIVLQRRSSKISGGEAIRNEIAFILHGVTFGYEKAARDLLGTPALFKYVFPRTYEFLDRLLKVTGFNLKKLEKMNLHDALEEFMQIAAKIGMAEKIKINWKSEKEFTVESINCSTANVRSYMTNEELKNAICPWAIIAATVANKITGREITAEPSEFNPTGAKTNMKISDEE
jgi:hypothetical protein